MSVSFTRLWMLRLVRCGLGIIVALVCLCALLWAYVNWSGPRHWAAVRARLESEGETLDFTKLLPAREDPGTNFCAIDALDGIALRGDDQSVQGRKRKALNQLGWLSSGADQPKISGCTTLGQKINLAAWARYARATGFIQMPPDSGNVARDLLQAIDASLPLAKVLADAASTRPNAAFTPLLSDNMPGSPLISGLLVQYCSPVFNAQKGLCLRSLAASECGDTAASIASAQAMLRFADALGREPLTFQLLASRNTHDLAEEAIWSILERRNATEMQLQAIETSLERLAFLPRALAAIRGELIIGVDFVDHLQRNVENQGELLRMLGGSLPPVERGLTKYWGWLPSGIFDENRAVLASLEYESIVKPLKSGEPAGLMKGDMAINRHYFNNEGMLHPGCFVGEMIVPELQGISVRLLATEAVRRQAIIACALERYYLQHKNYPAALVELVPLFVASIPADPMDDKPMRYRQTGDGRYMLWSVGFDQKDDNGIVNVDPSDRSSVHKLYKRGYKGDWTWQYRPVK